MVVSRLVVVALPITASKDVQGDLRDLELSVASAGGGVPRPIATEQVPPRAVGRVVVDAGEVVVTARAGKYEARRRLIRSAKSPSSFTLRLAPPDAFTVVVAGQRYLVASDADLFAVVLHQPDGVPDSLVRHFFEFLAKALGATAKAFCVGARSDSDPRRTEDGDAFVVFASRATFLRERLAAAVRTAILEAAEGDANAESYLETRFEIGGVLDARPPALLLLGDSRDGPRQGIASLELDRAAVPSPALDLWLWPGAKPILNGAIFQQMRRLKAESLWRRWHPLALPRIKPNWWNRCGFAAVDSVLRPRRPSSGSGFLIASLDAGRPDSSHPFISFLQGGVRWELERTTAVPVVRQITNGTRACGVGVSDGGVQHASTVLALLSATQNPLSTCGENHSLSRGCSLGAVPHISHVPIRVDGVNGDSVAYPKAVADLLRWMAGRPLRFSSGWPSFDGGAPSPLRVLSISHFFLELLSEAAREIVADAVNEIVELAESDRSVVVVFAPGNSGHIVSAEELAVSRAPGVIIPVSVSLESVDGSFLSPSSFGDQTTIAIPNVGADILQFPPMSSPTAFQGADPGMTSFAAPIAAAAAALLIEAAPSLSAVQVCEAIERSAIIIDSAAAGDAGWKFYDLSGMEVPGVPVPVDGSASTTPTGFWYSLRYGHGRISLDAALELVGGV